MKQINKALIQSLKDEMYEKHPEYKTNRINNFYRKKQRKHEHSSSESSLERYDNYSRKKIIRRWNEECQMEKDLEKRNRNTAQKKIDIAILERKLRNIKNYDEDEKINEYIRTYRRNKEERYEDSDETVSKEDI